jgi:hypothetical protein
MPVKAQDGVLLHGVADAELWKTDTLSTLLTKNHGRVGVLGRVWLWTAFAPTDRFVIYAQGKAEGGSAASNDGVVVTLPQAGLRFTASPALVIDVGKMAHPVGVFSARVISDRNPLIGIPDGYPVRYPLAAQVSGSAGIVDYRAAVVSLPVTHPSYVPRPTPSPRPALGIGLTPFIGLHVGASGTWGPYLNKTISAAHLRDQPWDSYGAPVFAADLSFSRGYLELRGESAWSWYDVPGRTVTSDGIAFYVEARYTFSPRVYVATRLERNDYPFILPILVNTWVANVSRVDDGELGFGFRLGPTTLLKVSGRADKWLVAPSRRAIQGDGHALGVQLSQGFDVLSWLPR